MVQRIGLLNLVREEPLAALRYVDGLPPGAQRDYALETIATGYARVDPEAAFAWAQSLQPPVPGVLANVLAGLARADATRAVDLVFAMVPANEQMPVLQMLVRTAVLSAEQTAAVADRLLAAPGQRWVLQNVANGWAQRAPQEALQWLLANGDRAPTASFVQAGTQLGRTDPSAGAALLSQIPSALRGEWLAAVAGGYAGTDPQAAAKWIAQYQGQQGYEAAVAAIAEQGAKSDPMAAARLLRTIDAARIPQNVGAAVAIATQWARQNPSAAADWALSLGDEAMRSRAVTIVAEQWSASDAPSARAWALGLAAGAERDAALPPVLGALTASTGFVEQSLLNAFSDSAAQQQGLSRAVLVVAQRDPAAARRLANDYLTDPVLREYAERFITQGKSVGPNAARL
jgi:hypothetical protein